MILILVRHAIAEEPDAARWPDDGLRPLTAIGAKKMKRNARGLAQLRYHPAKLIASPLLRARETAEILRKELGVHRRVVISPALAPGGGAAAFLPELERIPENGVVVAVGHEPSLSALQGELIGCQAPNLEFKKGGVAVVEFTAAPALGAGLLRAVLPPFILRKLA